MCLDHRLMGQSVWSMNERERKYGTILRALNAKPRRGKLIVWERFDNVEGKWEEKIQKGC